MSKLNKNITPRTIGKPARRAVCQNVTINFLNGAEYASARIHLLDEDNRVVASHDVAFSEAELSAWGTDDTFVLNLALSKLGV
jgi:hypothetical protein